MHFKDFTAVYKTPFYNKKVHARPFYNLSTVIMEGSRNTQVWDWQIVKDEDIYLHYVQKCAILGEAGYLEKKQELIINLKAYDPFTGIYEDFFFGSRKYHSR